MSARNQVSMLQLGNADLLTVVPEPSNDELLQAAAKNPATVVKRTGPQGSLFGGEVEQVEIINGRTKFLATAEKAARYGLRASE